MGRAGFDERLDLRCRFPGAGTRIALAKGVSRAMVIGCRFDSPASGAVENDSAGAVKIDPARMTTPAPADIPLPLPKDHGIPPETQRSCLPHMHYAAG